MADNTQIVLLSTPQGPLEESHFELRSAPVPTPAHGEVLVKNILLSQDAANRAWMQGPTYRQQVLPGDVMHGACISQVVEPRDARFSAGEIVLAEGGWQEYAALPGDELEACPNHRPLSHLHSILGIAGKTAYHGLLGVSGIQQGETLLVSAAAGSVGSIVGQIGKIKGAHVVGVAGGPEKCTWVQSHLGFDDCIDYKNEDLGRRIGEACPQGIDVYFDNVGGEILQAALFAMREGGRIVCCGAVSQYNDAPTPGPFGVPGLLVVRRLRMEGFIFHDFADRDAEAVADLQSWAQGGQIQVVEDIIDGLENAPRGLIGLLAGENRGKRMIRVSADPE